MLAALLLCVPAACPPMLLAPAASAVASRASDEPDPRAVLAELVAVTDPRERAKMARAAADALAELDREKVLAALRRGPLVPEDHGEGRTVAGEREEVTEHGTVRVGYAFEHRGERFRYAVDVPRRYDPGEPAGVLLDPGHGTGKGQDDAGKAGFLAMYRRHADEARHADWLVVRTEILEAIGGDGARGQRPDAAVAAAFDACVRDLATRFAIDPDRLVVAGVSQTATYAWVLGRERPGRWAALAPMGSAPYTLRGAEANLLALPSFPIHGSTDTTCPVPPVREAVAALQRVGAPVSYLEVEGAGHDYEVWSRLPEVLRAVEPRERFPLRVSKTLLVEESGAFDGWCHWLRVDELVRKRGDEAPGIDAEVDGQTVRLASSGVARVTLALAPELVDIDADVEVLWNGKTAFSGRVERDLAATLELAAERVDWTALAEAALVLEAP